MNSKVWLIVYGVVTALAVLGTGFYAYSSHSRYKESLSGWDSQVGTIETLERRVPFPNAANEKALGDALAGYKGSVEELFQSLKAFNRDLNTELLSTEFQVMVKERVEAFREFAVSKEFEIDSETGFQLGFDTYAQNLPQPELVAILDYELEAIDHLLKTLVNSGAHKMTTFQRDLIPGESGATAKEQESGVVHKYPVRLGFEATHEAFQEFINAIANDPQFFYIVRVLRVVNENAEGPFKSTQQQPSDIPRFQNPTTMEVVMLEQLREWGYDNTPASLPAVMEKAREQGFVYANSDARVLMGQERLKVFMVVDIVRFMSLEDVAAQQPQVEEETTPRRRRR